MDQKTKTLHEIVGEFEGDIAPEELQDVLESIRTLKNATGFGSVELQYGGSELKDIHIRIWKKPKNKKTI